MIIIPAIDIIDGKCVRLSKGDYNTQKTYSTNPLEVAKSFEAIGITHLHLVDLDGAKSSQIKNQKVLETIATNTKLKIDFGGGIKSQNDIEIAFNCGANQITGGSIAIQNPELFEQWIKTYGADKIILGADCKNRKIATNGWLQSSETEVIQFISDFEKKGIRSVICTDIDKDGMLQGASEELYTDILNQTSVQLIASGGVSNLDDLATLKNIGCHAAIVGKAIYEGNISMKELEKLC